MTTIEDAARRAITWCRAGCGHGKAIDCLRCVDELHARVAAEIQKAVDEERELAAAIANAEAQSNALARDRARAAGRKLVAECRQSDVETAERIRDRIRERK
jgi:hypothetical protein